MIKFGCYVCKKTIHKANPSKLVILEFGVGDSFYLCNKHAMDFVEIIYDMKRKNKK